MSLPWSLLQQRNRRNVRRLTYCPASSNEHLYALTSLKSTGTSMPRPHSTTTSEEFELRSRRRYKGAVAPRVVFDPGWSGAERAVGAIRGGLRRHRAIPGAARRSMEYAAVRQHVDIRLIDSLIERSIGHVVDTGEGRDGEGKALIDPTRRRASDQKTHRAETSRRRKGPA